MACVDALAAPDNISGSLVMKRDGSNALRRRGRDRGRAEHHTALAIRRQVLLSLISYIPSQQLISSVHDLLMLEITRQHIFNQQLEFLVR